MSRTKARRIRLAHWTVTLLFLSLQGWAALQFLNRAPRISDAVLALGYPAYLMNMLGVATLLGILAIASGLSPTLKEWAYAGFALEECGAFASHLSAGDSFKTTLLPITVFAIQLASYLLWKRSQRGAFRRRRQRFSLYDRASVESHA
jgi:DoxX-like protein